MKDITNQIFDTYNNQYNMDENQWRNIGGKQKSNNIIQLCKDLQVKNTLDVGSGDGAVLEFLDKKGFCSEISSIEISESGIKKIKDRGLNSLKEIKLFNGYTIPYSDKEFELATCSHVIEHVEHPRTLLREIGRVSTYQYFEIPIDFSFFVDKKLIHYLEYGHINIFTPSLFKFLIKSEGFEVLNELFIFNSNELLKFQFQQSKKKYWIQKFKNFIISLTPYRKIKPSSYAILCKHSGNNLKIF